MIKYKNIELVDIPSGMGGTLPAAVAVDNGEDLQVICLHHEFYPACLLNVKRKDVKPMTWTLKPSMKKIINKRMGTSQ